MFTVFSRLRLTHVTYRNIRGNVLERGFPAAV